MFSKIAIALTFVAVAVALPGRGPEGGEYCNTGSMQCCNSVQDARSEQVVQRIHRIRNDHIHSHRSREEAALDHDALDAIVGPVGVDCSSVLGGSSSCSAQPVCCSGNNFNGLIVVGCSPINIGL